MRLIRQSEERMEGTRVDILDLDMEYVGQALHNYMKWAKGYT